MRNLLCAMTVAIGLLVAPGPAGAQIPEASSTTIAVTLAEPAVADPEADASSGWSTQRRVDLIVVALVVVALAVTVLTVLYWRHTRPSVGADA